MADAWAHRDARIARELEEAWGPIKKTLETPEHNAETAQLLNDFFRENSKKTHLVPDMQWYLPELFSRCLFGVTRGDRYQPNGFFSFLMAVAGKDVQLAAKIQYALIESRMLPTFVDQFIAKAQWTTESEQLDGIESIFTQMFQENSRFNYSCEFLSAMDRDGRGTSMLRKFVLSLIVRAVENPTEATRFLRLLCILTMDRGQDGLDKWRASIIASMFTNEDIFRELSLISSGFPVHEDASTYANILLSTLVPFLHGDAKQDVTMFMEKPHIGGLAKAYMEELCQAVRFQSTEPVANDRVASRAFLVMMLAKNPLTRGALLECKLPVSIYIPEGALPEGFTPVANIPAPELLQLLSERILTRPQARSYIIQTLALLALHDARSVSPRTIRQFWKGEYTFSVQYRLARDYLDLLVFGSKAGPFLHTGKEVGEAEWEDTRRKFITLKSGGIKGADLKTFINQYLKRACTVFAEGKDHMSITEPGSSYTVSVLGVDRATQALSVQLSSPKFIENTFIEQRNLFTDTGVLVRAMPDMKILNAIPPAMTLDDVEGALQVLHEAQSIKACQRPGCKQTSLSHLYMRRCACDCGLVFYCSLACGNLDRKRHLVYIEQQKNAKKTQ